MFQLFNNVFNLFQNLEAVILCLILCFALVELLKRSTRVQFPIGSNQRLSKLVFTASLIDLQPPTCVVDRWVGGSLTRRLKGPFAVSWPVQHGEQLII